MRLLLLLLYVFIFVHQTLASTIPISPSHLHHVSLIDELLNLPNTTNTKESMLTWIQNWMKLITLLPFSQENRHLEPSQCELGLDYIPKTIQQESDHTVRRYAKYAGAAYCLANHMILQWTCLGHCKDGTEDTKVIHLDVEPKSQIKYFIAIHHSSKSIIVSIRGTLAPMNLFIDLSWVPVHLDDFPGVPSDIRVHAGFLLASLRLSTRIRQDIQILAQHYTNYTIDFTGHSLGGAVAQLVALNIAATTPIPPERIRIFSYGSPRVGNPAYAHFMNQVGFLSMTRVTFSNDPIPHLPPRRITPLINFQHIPGERFLSGWWISHSSNTYWLMDRLRRLTGFQPFVKQCQDHICEDTSCSISMIPFLIYLHIFELMMLILDLGVDPISFIQTVMHYYAYLHHYQLLDQANKDQDHHHQHDSI
jgi:hypothetical protein